LKEIAKMSIGELAAFVCSHLQKQGIEVVLTGGGCVEIYSSGKYSSFDLNFIENVPVGGRKLGKVMEEIQFFRKDRYFVLLLCSGKALATGLITAKLCPLNMKPISGCENGQFK